MKYIELSLTAILVGWLIIGCGKKGNIDQDLRSGEHNHQLGELLEKNVQIITISELERTYIPVETEIESEILKISEWIADLSGVEIDDNFIYITDRKKHQMLRYDTVSQTIEFTGQEGRGPNDFNDPTEIRVNSNYIFVYENGNARLQILDKQLEHIHSLSVNMLLSGTGSSMDVNEENILIPFFTGELDNAVQVYSSNEPFTYIKGIMPRLVPLGGQPGAINQVKIKSDTNQGFYGSYFGLPYLFVFDKDLNHIKTIEFRGKYIDEFYEIIPEGMSERSFRENAVRQLIHSFDVTDNTLYLFVKGDLLVIDLDKYQVKKSFRFMMGDSYLPYNKVIANKTGIYLIDNVFNNRVVHVNSDLEAKLLFEAKAN